MCGVMAALTGISTGLSLLQQRQQANAQSAAYAQQAENARASAQIAANNAVIQEYNARANEKKGEQVADQYLQQQQKLNDRRKLLRGQIAAEQGASGTYGGSGLDILSSSNQAYQMDSLNLLQNQRNDMYDNRVQTWNYNQAAQDYKNQQASYLTQASAYDSAASNVKKQYRMGALGTLASGALSIYGLQGSSSPSTYSSNLYSGDYSPRGFSNGLMNPGWASFLKKNGRY